ncbi:hypothetical protein UC8_42600 [Roseimaritima ulvae]|uniref:Uncharacterized protein n=1 Tax=Roseimaritima ulvae TaxID=980254 RepID=A0A5B9QYK0_9BACT|nr:hypothetical protein UC8_42600 [Roseimaritima ulvae]
MKRPPSNKSCTLSRSPNHGLAPVATSCRRFAADARVDGDRDLGESYAPGPEGRYNLCRGCEPNATYFGFSGGDGWNRQLFGTEFAQ